MKKISVAILSGGRSSRMGIPKASLKIRGSSFARHIADQMSDADEILFSVRKEEDFPDVPIRHIPDLYPGCGPMAGIHSALIHSSNPLVFIVACDMPCISRTVPETLADYYKEGVDAVIPVAADGTLYAVCGLYHKRMIPLLEEQLKTGNYRLRKVLEECRCIEVSENSFADHEKLFRNVNTPEDYREVIL